MRRQRARAFAGCAVVAITLVFTGMAWAQELVFWHPFTQPERIKALEEQVRTFEAKHPGVKISTEVVPWQALPVKWTTSFAAGRMPDVIAGNISLALAMYDAGAIDRVDDVVQKLGGERAFVAKPLEMLRYKGAQVALPFYSHARVLLFRKDWLEEKGLKPPKTWDDLMKDAVAMTQPPNRYGMIVPFGKQDYMGTLWLYIFTRTAGGQFLDKNMNLTFNSPEVIKAAKFLVELYKKASPPGSINFQTGDLQKTFSAERANFFFETGFNISWTVSQAPHLAPHLSAVAAPIPEGGQEAAMSDHIVMMVGKSSKNRALAAEFLASLYEQESYIKFLHLVPGGMMPTMAAVAKSREFWAHPMIVQYRPIVEAVMRGIEIGSPIAMENGPNPYSHYIQNLGVVEQMFQDIVQTNRPVEQAVAETHEKLAKLIADAKAGKK